jgi:hypothetical protein
MTFERMWCMPNRYTFCMSPVVKLLHHEIDGKGDLWADPFAGRHGAEWAKLTNDIQDLMPTAYHEDGLAFLKLLASTYKGLLSGVLFDPPYSPEQARRCYKAKFEGIAGLMEYHGACKDEIANLVRPGGKVICFGWNSCGMGKSRNFDLVSGLLLCHGQRHDTIITVEVKR